MEARVSRGEMVGLFKDLERMVLQLADRQEAIFLTLKRQGREEFDALFSDSTLRIRQWRLKIQHLTNGGLSLREFDDEATSWNSDIDNPRIGAHCFPFDWLAEKVQSDEAMNTPEKTLFLQLFGFTDQGIAKVLGEEKEPTQAESERTGQRLVD